MDQFLTRLLDKCGLLRIGIAVLSGSIVLWALAHFAAAPGSTVSVLWGLVQYTKSKPVTPPIASVSTETTKLQQEPSNSQETVKSTGPLPAIPNNLGVLHGITQRTMDQTLQSIRARRQLRALDALESGRSVADTPRGSYFFVYIVYLSSSSRKMVETLNSDKVSRFRNNNYYFEIHYPKSGAPIIVGFASESDAARLSSPSHEIRKVSLAALPWEKMSSLVFLPADRIISSTPRSLDLSERDRIPTLDIEIN